MFDASYLVMGLGDVYLGAPVATPLDPRHRLVTTKYNPARTWTPENAVGIGGAYLCVYGMEGPGGYQFVGPHAADVEPLAPRHAGFAVRAALAAALLRPDPLLPGERRRAAATSAPTSRTAAMRCASKKATFSLRDYRRFLADNADSIGAFKTTAAGRVRSRARALGRQRPAAVTRATPMWPQPAPESELDLPDGGRATGQPACPATCGTCR